MLPAVILNCMQGIYSNVWLDFTGCKTNDSCNSTRSLETAMSINTKVDCICGTISKVAPCLQSFCNPMKEIYFPPKNTFVWVFVVWTFSDYGSNVFNKPVHRKTLVMLEAFKDKSRCRRFEKSLISYYL